MPIKNEFVRNMSAKNFNRLQGQRLQQESLKKVENHMVFLRIFAALNEIPEHPKMPPTFPMNLNENSVQNLPYRNYLIRHHIKQAENTLNECNRIKGNRYIGYYSLRVGQQEKSLDTLVGLLKKA